MGCDGTSIYGFRVKPMIAPAMVYRKCIVILSETLVAGSSTEINAITDFILFLMTIQDEMPVLQRTF